MNPYDASSPRVLVLEAGAPPGNNFIRSLKAGYPQAAIVGCNDSPFVLKKSLAERNYLLPPTGAGYVNALRRIVRDECIDLIIPTNDGDALEIARLRRKLGCRTFLPRTSLIERCHDKYTLTAFLRRQGIAAPRTYPIANLETVERIFRRLAPAKTLWCRIRAGAGSYGAIPVETPEQVRSWIDYWERMRSVPPGSFTLSEYLPGRDFCVQCLWQDGTLVLAKMAERMVYLDNGGPSGVSSTPALAKTAYERHVVKACEKAIRALDPKVSGAFFVDIKESEDGKPCITEINAGRLATITNIHDLVGKHNMAALYVRLGMGERVRVPHARDFAEGYYLVRSVDSAPAIVDKNQLFEGIQDAYAG